MPSRPSVKKVETEIANDDMAASVQKTRRSQKPKAAPSTKSTSTTSSSSRSHPYLGNREVYAIEHWNDSIPAKATCGPNVPDGVDPVIQAYMQAKMALFQTLSLLAWTSTSFIAFAVHFGVGVYNKTLQSALATSLVLANNDAWILTVGVTKLSILMQYLRIFSSRTTRSLCYLLLFFVVLATSWAFFRGTFLCIPMHKLWKPEVPGHCVDAEKYWLSVAVVNTALDSLVLCLPIPAISSLHLPRKQKASLVLVFTLGFFGCATSVARIVTVLIIADAGHHVLSGIWAIVWSTVEANVGIICACLLALKPLVVMLFPKLLEENDEIPTHCMQLAPIPTGSAWPSDSPTTPTTTKSKSEGTLKRLSTANALPTAQPGRPLPAGSTPVAPATFRLQRPPPARRGRGGEREVVGFMDMLGDDLV
ncbi:hypothetical protein LTR36_004381 [Oleoguttula mirabilis]|uniref:Rhodopsin domain-containing protein n=1 Tax=Oleoguttula mirabilis TaxID=1507867 RepID=A0AAV9JFS7_9PEZI|nr:hypothetical protein LTR36_004381 [Oleoguttula mirabilis]